MSAYTKANGYLLISGDLKEATRIDIEKNIKQCQSKIDKCEDSAGYYQEKLDYYMGEAIQCIDQGIKAPFLSLIGFTTPVSFYECVDHENATNGFISRSFIVQDSETNPRPVKTTGFKKQKMTQDMEATLKYIHKNSAETRRPFRVMHTGDKQQIKTTTEASRMLQDVSEWFWSYGETLKSKNGLEAIARRGYEAVCKISFILAIPGGLREPEHVRWAFAFAKRDIEGKVRLAEINTKDNSLNSDDQGDVLIEKVLIAAGEDGEPMSVIKRRVGRKYQPEDVEKVVEKLLTVGKLKKVEKAGRGRKSVRYSAVG